MIETEDRALDAVVTLADHEGGRPELADVLAQLEAIRTMPWEELQAMAVEATTSRDEWAVRVKPPGADLAYAVMRTTSETRAAHLAQCLTQGLPQVAATYGIATTLDVVSAYNLFGPPPSATPPSSTKRPAPWAYRVDDRDLTVAEWLAYMREQLETQNDCCTTHAIQFVQEEQTIYGMDPAYGGDNYHWVDDESRRVDDDLAEVLDALAEELAEDEVTHEGVEYRRVHYITRWENVQPFLTRAAAQTYCDTQEHRHEGRLRIYVDSAYRNPEWRTLRHYFLEKAASHGG